MRTAKEISQDAATPLAGCGRGCPRGGAPEAGSAEKVTPKLGLEDRTGSRCVEMEGEGPSSRAWRNKRSIRNAQL